MTTVDSQLPQSELLAKAKEGLLWGGGYRLFQLMLQTAITLTLVRLLTPTDYGIYAVVASVIGLVNAISFESFLAHTLQVRRDDEVHFQDHFTAALVLQAVVFAVSVGIAITWGVLRGFAGIPLYLLAMSPVLLLSVFGGFRSYMLRRELNWRRERVLLGLGILSSGVVSIILALAGWGVFALLLAPHFKYLPFLVELLCIVRWRPTFQWTWRNYVDAWKFGLKRLGSNYFGRGGQFLQQVGVAHFASVATLGLFGRTLGLFRISVIQFSTAVMQAIYPVLTKVEPHTPAFAKAANLVMRGVCWIVIPSSVMLGLYGDVVVRVVYGERWLEVIPLLPLAMGIGGTMALAACVAQLALANQQASDCMYADAGHFVGMTLSIPLLALGSLHLYMLGLLATEGVILVVLCWRLRQARGATYIGLFRAFAEPTSAILVAVSLTFAWVRLASLPTDVPLWGGVAAVGCGFIYLTVLRFLFPARSLS